MVDGWSTVTELRSKGSTAGTSDTYFLSPTGRRFRSRPEIASHLQLGPARSADKYHKSRKRLRGGNPAIGSEEAVAAEGVEEVEAEEEGEEEGEDAEEEEEEEEEKEKEGVFQKQTNEHEHDMHMP